MGKIVLVVPEAPVREGAPAESKRVLPAGKRLRIGTLDNSKSNADHLLRMLIEGLEAHADVASVVSLRKPSVTHPADRKLLDRLVAEADIVVSAMAD